MRIEASTPKPPAPAGANQIIQVGDICAGGGGVAIKRQATTAPKNIKSSRPAPKAPKVSK